MYFPNDGSIVVVVVVVVVVFILVVYNSDSYQNDGRHLRISVSGGMVRSIIMKSKVDHIGLGIVFFLLIIKVHSSIPFTC